MIKLKRELAIFCLITFISSITIGMLLFPVNVSAAMPDLSAYYNKDMFSYDTNRNNGTDPSFSADLANSSITFSGAEYALGSFADNANNIVECQGQDIPLTQSMYSAIGFLGFATDSDSTGTATGKFKIYYTDGTFSEARITFADWITTDSDVLKSQNIALTMGHRHVNNKDFNGNTNIYAYYLYPTPGKIVASVKLSTNTQLKILAMSLFRGVSVDLGNDFNRDGISPKISMNDGDFDGSGDTYPNELFIQGGTYYGYHTVVNDSVAYNIPSNTANEFSNIVDCKGQYIVMPQAKYNSINIAGASTSDSDTQTGTFTIYYTDGTSDNADVTMKNWGSSDTTGQTILKTVDYIYNSSIGKVAQPHYIFKYNIASDPMKVVERVGLPNNPYMHIIAITGLPSEPVSEIADPAPNPRVVMTYNFTEDVPVIMYDVTQFGAVADDSGDDTVAFQRALDAAYKSGGGVVFAPAGKYVFLGHFSIPASVTLRGDWYNPDNGSKSNSTILEAYEGKDDEQFAPFISMHDASALREVTIWYPEQNDTNNIHPYPWTISTESDITYGPTVKNVTLVNSYKGINATLAAGALFKNVYGTVLKTGLYIDRIGDIIRPQTVHFRPKFWAQSGLGAAPSITDIANYTRNNANGVIIKRNDWGYMYDVYLESFKTALTIDKNSYLANAVYNGQIMNLTITDSTVGVDIKYAALMAPIMISNSTINTVGTNGISVKVENSFESNATVTFNTGTISSPDGVPVQMDGKGVLNFVHCTFGDHDPSKYAVTATDGSLILEGNTFSVDKPDIKLDTNVISASISGNAFLNNTPDIVNNSLGDIKIDNDSLSPSSFEQAPGNPTLPSYRKPDNNSLYNVKSYGAVGDAETDDTTAFQTALDAASSSGGGTVYVPAGYYKISTHISIASNVELRGISEGPHHFGTNPRGSVLLVYENKNNPSGTEFITLAANAGVRGLSIFYPEQVYTKSTFYSYPATIKFDGTGDYVFDVTFGNAYDAMKVTNGDYYIDSSRGLGVHKYIDISSVSTPGYLVNVQNTMGDWQDLMREENSPPLDCWMYNPSFDAIGINVDNSSNILAFNGFTFGIGKGTVIQGESSNNKFYGQGHDAAQIGVSLYGSGIGNVFLNTQITAPGTAKDHYTIFADQNYTGDTKFIATGVWATGLGEIISGGNVTLQQLSTDSTGVLNQSGGTMILDSSVFMDIPKQIHINSNVNAAYAYSSVGHGGKGVIDKVVVPYANGAGSISGTVTDGKDPIEGISINLVVDGIVYYSATTGVDGKYTLSGVKEGTGYFLTASKTGYNDEIATGVNVTEGTALVVDISMKANFVLNPGFEVAGSNFTDISSWSTSGNTDADYTQGGGHTGSMLAGHYYTSNYNVYTYQTVSGLANGLYTLKAWVKSSPDLGTAYMNAKDYGGGEIKHDIPLAAGEWTQISIENINVTNGQCTVGFYSDSPAGTWYVFDDVELAHSLSNTTLGVIAGKVDDGANPVAGANVSVTTGSGITYSATTGADGTYTISSVPVGTGYTVTASKTGYNKGTATGVVVTAGAETSNVKITLTAIINDELTNPGFEIVGANPQDISSWSTSGNTDADYTQGGGHTGSMLAGHYYTSNYNVYTYQTVSGLTNGLYTLKAWVKSSPDLGTAYMNAKDYGGGEIKHDIPLAAGEWTQISIENINVTNGQCTVGFYSDSPAGTWYVFDDVELVHSLSNTTPGVISGMVNDGVGSVEGVSVSLVISGITYSATTGADGTYTISGVPVGTGYTVTASKTGYNNGTAAGVNVTAGAETSSVNITLSAIINYEITNPGFEIVGADPQEISSWSTSGNTDADYTQGGGHTGSMLAGHYYTSNYNVYTYQTVSGLANGLYTLKAWVKSSPDLGTAYMNAKDYGSSEMKYDIPQAVGEWTQISIENINVTNGQCTVGFYSDSPAGTWYVFDDVEFTAVPMGTISGTVTDGVNPVVGANVIVTIGSGITYSATTGADGTYTISGVPVGTGYTVTASKTGYNNGTAAGVNVTAGAETSSVNITLSAIINYELTNPGFEIVGANPQDISSWSTSGNTDADYTQGGGHTGSMSAGHYYTSNYNVYTYQTVSGLTNGLYTVKAWVKSSPDLGTAYMNAKDYGGGEIKHDIPLATGEWTQISIENINVTNGQCTVGFYSDSPAGTWYVFDDVELAAAPMGAISGTVTDGANPVAGANVSVTTGSGIIYSATTGADGTYTISNVPVGTGYTVTASKAGYSNGTAAEVKVTAGVETSNVNITLTAITSVNGQSSNGSNEKENEKPQLVEDHKGNISITVTPVLDSSTSTATVMIKSDILINAFNLVKANEDGIKTVKLDIMKVNGAKEYESTLPAGFLTSGDALKVIEIKTEFAVVTFSESMLNASNAAGARNISLSIASGDKKKLNTEVQAQIGNRPILELNLKIDGKLAYWNNDSAPVKVSIPYVPTEDELKDLEHITVWYIDSSGNAISVPNSRYDPDLGIVTFSTTHFSKYAVAFVYKTFSDISGYDWARKQIEVLASKGIISGISTDNFSPDAGIKRADYILLLVRSLGLSAKFENNFNDVEPGSYYYEAVGIAKKLGIAAGYMNNRFNPMESITRQDMMVLTTRALERLGKLKLAESSTKLDKFKDKNEIADYVVKKIAALVEEGLISGFGNNIKPRAKTSRAEAAVLLYRIYNKNLE